MDRKPHQILYTVRGSCSPGTEFKIKKSDRSLVNPFIMLIRYYMNFLYQLFVFFNFRIKE